MIAYRTGNDLDLDAVIELYRASTLGERRPVDDPSRMAAMLRHANLVITAWDGPLLVGISRSLSEQSAASRRLHEVTSRMSDHISEINRATREQARGTQLMAQ